MLSTGKVTKGTIGSTSYSCWVPSWEPPEESPSRRVATADAEPQNATRDRNWETSTQGDKKVVPLQVHRSGTRPGMALQPPSPTAVRQALQGLLKEGNHFPDLPAKQELRVGCDPQRCPGYNGEPVLGIHLALIFQGYTDLLKYFP